MHLANQRCIQAYCKKERDLREANKDNEALREEVEELREKLKGLNVKIQELCYRYLNYKTKKDNEIFELRANLEKAVQIIRESR